MRKFFALVTLAILSFTASIFAHDISVVKALPGNTVGKYVFVRPPIAVGDIVRPISYQGDNSVACQWNDGDGQPFPINLYSRSQDWVGQYVKVVSIYGTSATITTTGVYANMYYICWPLTYLAP